MISENQSGFRPRDSCINQLLCITHVIHQSFDDSLEVRAVFLNKSKGFDKEALIFKSKQNGISDKILNVITDFLSFRKQRAVLNGEASPWASIEVSVPQSFIHVPLLFLICINDLSDDLSTTPKLFADDMSLFSIVQNVNTSASHLNKDVRKVSNQAFQWKMRFLILTLVNKPRKLFSLVKSKRHVILPLISITSQSNKSLLKSIWE